MQVVIHKNLDGSVGVTVPAKGMDIVLVASQAAQPGQPYKIVDKTIVDAVYVQYGDLRNAWEWDEATVPDGVGADSNEYGA